MSTGGTGPEPTGSLSPAAVGVNVASGAARGGRYLGVNPAPETSGSDWDTPLESRRGGRGGAASLDSWPGDEDGESEDSEQEPATAGTTADDVVGSRPTSATAARRALSQCLS